MSRTATQLIDALVAGDTTATEVAKQLANHRWAPSPTYDEYAQDPEPADPNSWDAVSTDPRLSADDYALLTEAYVASQNVTTASGTLAFKFNPNQPRDDDGKWTDGPDVDLSDVTPPSTSSKVGTKASMTGNVKPVVSAIIYKKHADGTVVAESANERMRWDAGAKKFVIEKRDAVGWQQTAQLTKTAAYEDTKRPGRWFQPGTATAPATAESPTQVDDLPIVQLAPGAQKDAVDAYRVSGFIAVNKQLRTGVKQKMISMDTDELIAGMDTAMAANPLDRDVVVWRGVNVPPGDLTPGTILEDKAYVSTSRDRKQAEHFAQSPLDANAPSVEKSPTLLRIRVPKSTEALHFGGGEQEVLLNRGTKIKVQSAIKGKGVTIVNAEVVTTTSNVSSGVHKITPSEVDALLDEITGTDERAEFMRNALNGLNEFGPNVASTYVSRDDNGKLTGAMTIVDHVEDAEEQGASPYSTIDYIGAQGDGAGRSLVSQAVQHALDTNTTIMAEPTQDSLSFWEQMGFHEDPLGEGTELYGLTYDEAINWPNGGKNTSITPPETPQPAPTVSKPTVETSEHVAESLSNGLRAISEKFGVDLGDVEIIDSPGPAASMDLKTGKITANPAEVSRLERFRRIGISLGGRLDLGVDVWVEAGVHEGGHALAHRYLTSEEQAGAIRAGAEAAGLPLPSAKASMVSSYGWSTEIEQTTQTSDELGTGKISEVLSPYAAFSMHETLAEALTEYILSDSPRPFAQAVGDYVRNRVQMTALTAAAEVYTGAMIALVPSEEDATRLAVDGGEDVEQLHLTIAYLGEAALLPVELRDGLVECVSRWVTETASATVVGKAFAVNLFNPPDLTAGGPKPCVALGVSGGQLPFVHDNLVSLVRDEFAKLGVPFPEQHVPWIPHVTLVYTADADLTYFTDRLGSITFDRVRLAFAGENYDIPFGESNEVNTVQVEHVSNTVTSSGMLTSSNDDEEPVMTEPTLTFTESGEPVVPNVLLDWRAFAKERDVNTGPGPGHQLRDYWVRGEGAAKIGWGTDGSFARCVANLGKYVKDPQGLCAEYHKAATGEWPAEKGVESMAETETFKDEDTITAGVGKGDCPPGTHKMPSGKCMPDEDMDQEAKTESYEVETAVAPATAPWKGILTVEGIESGDGRMFAANALTWDEPPLPLMWQRITSHGGTGDESVRIGSIAKVWREDDPAGRSDVYAIWGEGTIDLNNKDGVEVYRRMLEGDMRGNSVDVDSVKGSDVELIYPESPTSPVAAEGDEQPAPPVVNMFPQPEMTVYKKGRIRASTMVEIPAFTEARLELTDEVLTAAAAEELALELEDDVEARVDAQLDALTAAVSTIEIVDAPPREWFDEPTDVAATGALTVTAAGRVYGYVAPAGVKHRSFGHKSVYVPLKNVDYSRFMGGETITADGGRVSTGAITMGCGHASTDYPLTSAQAKDHYDNTCSLVATVRVGENKNGVWFAGALLPDVTKHQVQRMMACRLSGDWRPHPDKNGWRELTAALLVPVPGFPMARTAPSVQVEEGQLVAASVPVQFQEGPGPRERAAAIVRAVRVQRLRAQVAAFHGTHNQKSHGNDHSVGDSGKPKIPERNALTTQDRERLADLREKAESGLTKAEDEELDRLQAKLRRLREDENSNENESTDF